VKEGNKFACYSDSTSSYLYLIRQKQSLGSLVTMHWLGYGLDDRGSVPGRGQRRDFHLCITTSRPGLRPADLPIHWVPVAVSSG